MHTDGRLFSLRARILELGYAYLSSLSLPEVAQRHMEALVARVHESCSVSVLDGDEVVYVARVPTKRIMTVAISVGTRFPAYATSMGRVLLAAQPADWLDDYLATAQLRPLTRRTVTDPAKLRAVLTRIAAQGYAIVDQELEEGLRSVAAPIHGEDGSVIAAVNVSAHATRGSFEMIRRELLPPLLAAAKRIEEDIRGGLSRSPAVDRPCRSGSAQRRAGAVTTRAGRRRYHSATARLINQPATTSAARTFPSGCSPTAMRYGAWVNAWVPAPRPIA